MNQEQQMLRRVQDAYRDEELQISIDGKADTKRLNEALLAAAFFVYMSTASDTMIPGQSFEPRYYPSDIIDDDEQEQALREAEKFTNSREEALIISLGLSLFQVKAINSYRTLLINNSREAERRALRDNRFDHIPEHSQALIDIKVKRYAANQRLYRQRTIARVETTKAVNAGIHDTYAQAIEQGIISNVLRTWITARDERVRDSHWSIDGEVRGFSETWRTSAGNELRYPGDPNAPASEVINCRCTLSLTLVNSK